MNHSRSTQVMLGFFVVMSVIVFLFFLLQFDGSFSLFQKRAHYVSYFTEVDGLQEGSDVTLSGIRIGKVSEILAPTLEKPYVQVSVEVSIEYSKQIKTDSYVSLKTKGMLGDKYFQITPGSMQAQPLESGGELETKHSHTFFSKGEGVLDDLRRHFHKNGHIEKTLIQIRKLAEESSLLAIELKQLSKDIRRENVPHQTTLTLKNIQESSEKLNSILSDIQEGKGTLGSLVQDPTVYEDLKRLLGGAGRSNTLRYFIRKYIEKE